MPLEIVEVDYKKEAIYDPISQTTQFLMGGKSTACNESTDGTQPKNEADKIMDDN